MYKIRTFAGALAVLAMIGVASAQTPALSLSITDGKNQVAPGSSMIYALTAVQNGAASMTTTIEAVLPSQLVNINPSGGVVNGSTVTWTNVTLSPNNAQTFTAQGTLPASVPLNTVLTATARAGTVTVQDTTTVQSTALQNGSFTIAISDGRTSALPGEEIAYTIQVKNTAAFSQTANITMNVSDQVEIMTCTDAAQLSYPTVAWYSIAFLSGEQKTFTCSARVHRRLTQYTALRTSASTGTQSATDTTTVAPITAQTTSSARSSSSRSSSVTAATTQLQIRNTATSGEILPGDGVRYVLTVMNRGDATARDPMVTVRYDATSAQAIQTDGGRDRGGRIEWVLPNLAPGEQWLARYVLRASGSLQNGDVLSTVATVSGDNLSDASLTERVTVTASATVIRTLPTTGTAYDILIVALAMIGSLFLAGMHRSIMR